MNLNYSKIFQQRIQIRQFFFVATPDNKFHFSNGTYRKVIIHFVVMQIINSALHPSRDIDKNIRVHKHPLPYRSGH